MPPLRSRFTTLAASALLCAALAAPARATTVAEFPLLVASSSPLGITAGPDGNLWFVEVSGSRFGRVTPEGKVDDFSTGSGISTNTRPWEITLGPDGRMWFTEEQTSRIAVLTPSPPMATELTAAVSPNSGPHGIAGGPDGNVWFAEDAGRIGLITPAGAVQEFSAAITPGSRPLGIATGPDGNLWFTELNGGIGRITPTGVVAEFTTGITPNSSPQEIAAGPDGNMWFTELAGRVARITTTGAVAEFSAGISANSRPRGIAAGPDGNMWFVEEAGNRVARITPAGVVTEYSAGISPGSGPTIITRGPDSNMWFTEASGNRIARVTLEPAVVTGDATLIGSTGTKLTGTVNPFTSRTSYLFEFGRTTGYDSATAPQVLNPGGAAAPVSAAVAGLAPSTLYHYRLVATSAAGTGRGADRTFTTAPPGVGPGGGAGGGGTTSSTDRTGPKMVVSSRALTLASKGRVRIALRCPLTETLGCRGTLRLETAARVRASAAALRRLRLGVASFKIGGGQARTVTVRLSRRARALLRARHRLAVRAVVAARDSAGNRKTTVKRLRLSSPKR